MPELPEVNRVANILRRVALGRTIQHVETTEDAIIYSDGISHSDFAKELQGRKVLEVSRRGKVFFMKLEGEGRHPVMHLGMTGNLYVKGTDPRFYQNSPKQLDTSWPPRFMKFILHLSDSPSTSATSSTEVSPEVVFTDPRRLGRIRLCKDPLAEPPISNLGFDPILSMPPLNDFVAQVQKKKCTIKSLLLDQNFSAGVGNWVADEVLFHARIHPEQKPYLLDEETIGRLHEKIKYVCETAVGVDADASQFPEGWLFKHRWGKGKKRDSDLRLPSGENAVIKWITVGSRTSAIVPKVQKLRLTAMKEGGTAAENDEDQESVLSEPPEEDAREPTPPVKIIKPKVTAKRGKRSGAEVEAVAGEGAESDAAPKPSKRRRKGSGGGAETNLKVKNSETATAPRRSGRTPQPSA